MEIAAIVAMLGASAFFSGSEIAFVVANRLRVEVKARRGGFAGKRVLGFLQDPTAFLTTMLVGNNIALVVYSTLMALHVSSPLHNLLEWLGIRAAGLEVAVPIAQTALAATIVLVVGEILPKSLLYQVADRAMFVLSVPLWIMQRLLLPFATLAGGASRLLVHLFGLRTYSAEPFPRRAFEVIIEESRKTGSLGLDEEESEILSNFFGLHDRRVKESMTPRTGIVAVDETTTLEDFRKQCIESGYSKVPVFRDNIDDIVGIAFAYDLFSEPVSLKDMMRPAKFVPESKPSRALLKEFRDSNSSIVIVVDEYGGTAGLITREDLLEELFGDIQDEFDSESVVLREVDRNTVIAGGRAELDELRERFGIDLPTGDYETVAGYLLERRGTIPAAQDEFEIDSYRFVILQAQANRIDLVRIIR